MSEQQVRVQGFDHCGQVGAQLGLAVARDQTGMRVQVPWEFVDFQRLVLFSQVKQEAAALMFFCALLLLVVADFEAVLWTELFG